MRLAWCEIMGYVSNLWQSPGSRTTENWEDWNVGWRWTACSVVPTLLHLRRLDRWTISRHWNYVSSCFFFLHQHFYAFKNFLLKNKLHLEFFQCWKASFNFDDWLSSLVLLSVRVNLLIQLSIVIPPFEFHQPKNISAEYLQVSLNRREHYFLSTINPFLKSSANLSCFNRVMLLNLRQSKMICRTHNVLKTNFFIKRLEVVVKLNVNTL